MLLGMLLYTRESSKFIIFPYTHAFATAPYAYAFVYVITYLVNINTTLDCKGKCQIKTLSCCREKEMTYVYVST